MVMTDSVSVSLYLLVHSVFAASPDVLYLWGPWQGEQGRLWSLHDLQQTGLQASLPCHLVSVKVCVCVYKCVFVVTWKRQCDGQQVSYDFEMKVPQQRCWKVHFILRRHTNTQHSDGAPEPRHDICVEQQSWSDLTLDANNSLQLASKCFHSLALGLNSE